MEKTVVLISSKLDKPTALNVVGHLALALGAAHGSQLVVTAAYRDLSGVDHRGVSAFPFVTLHTRPNKLRTAIAAARADQHLVTVDYPREVLTTGTDGELRHAIETAEEGDLEYLGVIAHGPRESVDAIFSSFSLITT
jgi:hypothetical protein